MAALAVAPVAEALQNPGVQNGVSAIWRLFKTYWYIVIFLTLAVMAVAIGVPAFFIIRSSRRRKAKKAAK